MGAHHDPMQTMSRYDHGPATPYQQQEVSWLLEATRTGMIVGGAGAAALNLHRMRDHGMGWQEALGTTLKTSLKAVTATAAASAIGRMFAGNPAFAVVATLATGTAVMYALTSPRAQPPRSRFRQCPMHRRSRRHPPPCSATGALSRVRWSALPPPTC